MAAHEPGLLTPSLEPESWDLYLLLSIVLKCGASAAVAGKCPNPNTSVINMFAVQNTPTGSSMPRPAPNLLASARRARASNDKRPSRIRISSSNALTTALVVRAVVLNGAAGLVFGMLYQRYGLEWAMASHFGTDLVLNAVAGA